MFRFSFIAKKKTFFAIFFSNFQQEKKCNIFGVKLLQQSKYYLDGNDDQDGLDKYVISIFIFLYILVAFLSGTGKKNRETIAYCQKLLFAAVKNIHTMIYFTYLFEIINNWWIFSCLVISLYEVNYMVVYNYHFMLFVNFEL